MAEVVAVEGDSVPTGVPPVAAPVAALVDTVVSEAVSRNPPGPPNRDAVLVVLVLLVSAIVVMGASALGAGVDVGDWVLGLGLMDDGETVG